MVEIVIRIPSLTMPTCNKPRFLTFSPSGVKRTFPCEEWFGKDESDGTLEKTLYPAVEADQSYKKSKILCSSTL